MVDEESINVYGCAGEVEPDSGNQTSAVFYSFNKAGGQYLPVVGVVVGDAIVRPGEREVDAYIHLKGGRSLIR